MSIWQILTSTAVGAIISGLVALRILNLTQRHAESEAQASRSHDRAMRRAEINRQDDREFTAVILDLTDHAASWAAMTRVTLPLVQRMGPADLVEWVDTDSGREIRDHAKAVGSLLIRAQLLSRDQELHEATAAIAEALNRTAEEPGIAADIARVNEVERLVFRLAQVEAVRRRKRAGEEPS